MTVRTENARLCALFALAFLATAGLLRPFAGGDHETELLDKLEHLEAHPTEYNALVIGASGVLRGVDPRVFDEAVRETEPEFRSFNLGARFMLAYEADALLRDAVETIEAGGGRVRWAFVEPKDWDPTLSRQDVLRVRTRSWHDLRETATALRVSADELVRAREPLGAAWAFRHTQAFAQRLANYGAARRLLRPLLGEQRRAYIAPERLADARGYVSIEDSEPEQSLVRNYRFMADLEDYSERLAAFAAEPPEAMHPSEHAATRRQREWLEARGIRVVHLMAPYATHGRSGEALRDSGAVRELIDFARPEEFPGLYVPEARLDREHLDAEAAVEFSQLAGQAVAEQLAKPLANAGAAAR